MKRCVALLLSALMLLTAIPAVGANSYNDDQFDWGEYACPHTQTETVEAVTSTCITPGHATYTYCVVCKLLLDGCRDDLPLGDHTYAVETTPADCLNAGRHVYTCSVCGDSYEETIPAIGHAYDSVVTAPDCVNGGYTTHTCANCGDTYTDSATTALGHNYVPLSAEPATCEQDGFEKFYCTHCNDSYTMTIPATGHAYDSVVTAPDCVSGGYTTHTCANCGDTYTDSATAALGHNYVPLSAEPATCEQDGFEKFYCTHCNDSYTVTIPAIGHAYDSVVTAPDCVSGGYTTHTCANCGDTYTDSATAALGHNYVPLSAEPATCEQDGFEKFYCTHCNDSYTVTIPAIGHAYDSVVTAPDCENSGYTVYTCTVCGHSYADNRVNALGHNYQVIEDVAPTCVADGKKVYTCANCGDTYTEIVPATGLHVYEYGCDETCNVCGYVRDDAHNYLYFATLEPTCGKDGMEAYKCWNCETFIYISIPATGNHTYRGVCDANCDVCGMVRDDVAPHDYHVTASVALTCVTDGVDTYTCQNCDDSYTVTIPAIGHKYEIVITAPTCESGGYTTHTCTACGDVVVDNHTDALGHTYDDDRDADCNTCGAVREVETVLVGDVNGDGKVNNKDLGRLQQYINGWEVEVDLTACDVTGDGKVNNKDLGRLQQYINGWDVQLG